MTIQAQDSLTDQLRRVQAMANAAGEYDAADWIAKKMDPEPCPMCYAAGWIIEAKIDKNPTTLELMPCFYPPCANSGRDVAVLCLYGEWENPVLHPQTGAVMSLSKTKETRWGRVRRR